MCFSSDQVITALASGDAHLSQVFSGDAYQAMRENKNIGYAIPIEGASIWTDNFCILATAPHKDAAYAWIQHAGAGRGRGLRQLHPLRHC